MPIRRLIADWQEQKLTHHRALMPQRCNVLPQLRVEHVVSQGMGQQRMLLGEAREVHEVPGQDHPQPNT